jgi:fatty-acid desaturase
MLRLSIAGFIVTYYLIAGLGVNLGYHRVLSHRSLKLPKWLERTLVTLGLPAGTPCSGRITTDITTCAKHGLEAGQFDWTWQVIRGLRALGLAQDIRVASKKDLFEK